MLNDNPLSIYLTKTYSYEQRSCYLGLKRIFHDKYKTVTIIHDKNNLASQKSTYTCFHFDLQPSNDRSLKKDRLQLTRFEISQTDTRGQIRDCHE